jgi:hypothetical protein
MTFNERVNVISSDEDGSELGSVELELGSDSFISVTMTDEDGSAALLLDISEAETLIAKLAVKVAQARMAQQG